MGKVTITVVTTPYGLVWRVEIPGSEYELYSTEDAAKRAAAKHQLRILREEARAKGL